MDAVASADGGRRNRWCPVACVAGVVEGGARQSSARDSVVSIAVCGRADGQCGSARRPACVAPASAVVGAAGVYRRDPVREDRARRRRCDLALTAIETSSRQAVLELYRLLGLLRQAGDCDELAEQPGLAQLPRLAASMSDSTLAVEVSVEGEQRPLPPTVDGSEYRIVQ